jgi:protein-tyrosine kinase
MSRIEDAMKRAGGTAAADAYANLDTTSVADVLSGDALPAAKPVVPPAEPAGSQPLDDVPQALDVAVTMPAGEGRTGLFEAYNRTIDAKLVVDAETPPIAREQYRRLAATLHHVQAERGIKSVMIASALAEEGKTLTAVNLALTLSESYQKRVLLIDADLRRPNVHNAFGIDNILGLSDVLRARDDQRLPLFQVSSRLSVLSAGKPNPDPMDILTSSRMIRILDEAGANFDWVIVDTPPVGILTDANLLAAMVDAALFVVAAGRAPYAIVRKAIDALGRDRILGVVLNRADSKLVSQNDYYYRYYGSRERKGFRLKFPGQ